MVLITMDNNCCAPKILPIVITLKNEGKDDKIINIALHSIDLREASQSSLRQQQECCEEIL